MIELLLFSVFMVLVVRHRFYWLARQKQNLPRFMAHRGIKIQSPENTLSSFKEAVDAGFKAIELDILPTQDGTLVCSHNFDLERETNEMGWIHQKKLSGMNDVQTGIYSHEANPQSIPTFSEALVTIPNSIFLNIEIKTHRLFDLSTARSLGQMIQENSIKHSFMVSSFNPIVVAYFRLMHPGVSVGYILQDMKWLWVTHWIHPDFFHPRGDLVDEDILTMCHRHGLPLNIWTINARSAMDWCNRNGISSMITDNPRAVHG